MGHNSLQVCMDSSDWLQGTIHEDSPTMDSSSPLSGDMLTCSRPMIERRLRPPQDQSLKCPRCESTHTKFCYYNNYSLSQPRYFCKTCRRYWTKGGTLRNIPVGGGCRKNKKVSPNSKKPTNNPNDPFNPSLSSSSSLMNPNGPSNSPMSMSMPMSMSSHLHIPTDLHLSFPDQMQFSHLNNLMLGGGGVGGGSTSNPSFMDSRYNGMMENSNNSRGNIDFMESKLEAIVGGNSSRNYDFMGADHLGVMGLGFGNNNNMGALGGVGSSGFCSPFDQGHNGNNYMDTCQRLMQSYDHHHDEDHGHDHDDHQQQNGPFMDVKPNTKMLSLEWQDHGKDHQSSFGYMNGMGGSSWMTNNVMTNYGP